MPRYITFELLYVGKVGVIWGELRFFFATHQKKDGCQGFSRCKSAWLAPIHWIGRQQERQHSWNQSSLFHDIINRRFNVSPTAIQANQCPTLFAQQRVVFWTEHLTAQRFENDTLFGECSKRFVQGQVATLARKNSCVLLWIVLSEPKGMDGDWIQSITPNH